MPLCRKCLSIDFDSLPYRPDGSFFYSLPALRKQAAKMGHPDYRAYLKENSIRHVREDRPGHVPYLLDSGVDDSKIGRRHRTYKDLLNYEDTCKLCEQIAGAAKLFRKVIANNEVFNKLYGPRPSRDFQIFLTKRVTEKESDKGRSIDGFLFWTTSCKSKHALFIGAIGFCVKSSS
jgi:hypothetical protein